MTRALLLVLVLLPAVAAAQAPANENPQPAKPPERPATERPGLNLRLDNPSSFATIAPAEKQSAPLPTLGGDARKLVPVPESREAQTIPKDTNPAR